MKSTVSEKPCKKKNEYPCLMTDTYKIVLFLSDNEGVVVSCIDTAYSFGEKTQDTIRAAYKPFHGSICLEN